MTATEAMTVALLALADRDTRTPCQGPHRDRWTSDDAEQRQWAAHCCRICPVLAQCAAAADEHDERWHVFGGTDRTRGSRRSSTRARRQSA